MKRFLPHKKSFPSDVKSAEDSWEQHIDSTFSWFKSMLTSVGTATYSIGSFNLAWISLFVFFGNRSLIKWKVFTLSSSFSLSPSYLLSLSPNAKSFTLPVISFLVSTSVWAAPQATDSTWPSTSRTELKLVLHANAPMFSSAHWPNSLLPKQITADSDVSRAVCLTPQLPDFTWILCS